MTRAEIRAYALTLGSTLAVLVLYLVVQGLLDRLELDAEERLAYRQWVSDACTPGIGETVIAKREGDQMRCAIYTRAERGFAPQLVSVAVMDVPQ